MSDEVIYENREVAEAAARGGATVDWSQVKGDDGLTDNQRRQKKHHLGEYAKDETVQGDPDEEDTDSDSGEKRSAAYKQQTDEEQPPQSSMPPFGVL